MVAYVQQEDDGIAFKIPDDADIHIDAALKTTNDIATGDMARVQRSIAKFGHPREKTDKKESL